MPNILKLKHNLAVSQKIANYTEIFNDGIAAVAQMNPGTIL